MKEYLDLLNDILQNGEKRKDRTGVGTLSVFSRSLRFDLNNGFPLLTTKKIHFKSVVHELIWFLRGDDNIKYLKDNGVSIWDEWADKNGCIGRMYGTQWRRWNNEFDQIKNIILQLKKDPHSRRHLVSAWNVSDLDKMALNPCHYAFQLYVSNDRKLSLKFSMRSIDTVLGLPFNLASYALLTHMIAQVCDLKIGDLCWDGGDCHIYLNHIEQVQEQLKRKPFPLSKLELNPEIKDIDDFKYEDIYLANYQHHPAIKAPIAV